MCNKLHCGYRRIPETGIGYKILTDRSVGEDYKVYPMFCCVRKFHRFEENIWDPLKAGRDEDGFCFFETLEEAKLYFPNFLDIFSRKIFKIQYSEGLGEVAHKQGKDWFKFKLCKRFQILEVVAE
jgi:hypothetical protein